jgi:phosphoribosylamine---glycine ligase
MRVLVIGSGGREHALCWKIAASPLLTKLWCAPGNAGTAQCAENVPIGVLDIGALVAFARDNKVDLVLPGPEAPLVAGVTDAMTAAGIPCCGPTAAAAQLEGSKTFTKELCDAVGIPTAKWEKFDDAAAALEFVRRRGVPIVVKADGLAGGKGVVVAVNPVEAEQAITNFLILSDYAGSAPSVVIEECLHGEEVSLFALCDGRDAIPLGAAQDHKRVGDGDVGPNTGGMGCYSPAPVLPPAREREAVDTIIRPALAEMAHRGTPFRGILYAGLMMTSEGAKLIEFNARFGDPECQVLMLRLKSDLLPALLAACDGELSTFDLRWRDEAAITVVMATRGYPGKYPLHTPIGGLDAASSIPGVQIFHAGTEVLNGRLVSTGGRVLNVCATGPDIRTARAAAYAAVDKINWPDGFCRRDIGWRALA